MNRPILLTMALGLAVAPVGRLEAQAAPPAAVADTLPLSLEQGLTRALGESQEVRLARSQVSLANAQVTAARAQLLPQINANLGYTKTLASAFDAGGGEPFALPDSLRFDPDPDQPLEQRVRYLENNAGLAGLQGIGGLFGDLPFGQENAYVATLSGQQLIWSGGRAWAGIGIAKNAREAARYNLTEETAEIQLQVQTAYYQALLAEQLEEISEAALAQAEAFLEQEQLRLRAGQAAELDVLRAEVSLENLRPQLVDAHNASELARLNLKRLTDIPASQPLRLTTALSAPPPEELAEAGLEPDVLSAQRAAVLAAEQQVEIQERQVRIARSAFQPNVSLQMSYGKQAFPSDIFDVGGDWRTDWTAGLVVSVPVFTGLRRPAEVQQARAQLEQARLQVDLLRESVQIQYEQARGEKERARAQIAARQRTVDQAQRVYDLTVLRYEEGLATQLEVSEARLELLQARTNLAQAIADYYIADAGLVRALGGSEEVGALPSGPSLPDAQPVRRREPQP